MRVLVLVFCGLSLSACVDPQLGLGMTIGSGGVKVSPSVTTGLEGGGTLTISP
jgi:predicted small secreted protein